MADESRLPPSGVEQIDRVRREYRAGELTYGDAVICIREVVNVTVAGAQEILDHEDDAGARYAAPVPAPPVTDAFDWTGWIVAHRRAAQRRTGEDSSDAVMADPEYARAMDIAGRAGIARNQLAGAEAEARAHRPEGS